MDVVKGPHQQMNEKEVKGLKIVKSSGCTDNLKLMENLKKKIMLFRDIIDLPPSDSSKSLDQVYFFPSPLPIIRIKCISELIMSIKLNLPALLFPCS